MFKYIGAFITLVLTSFFLFPVSLTIAPSVNLKTLMSVVGLLLLFVQLAQRRRAEFDSGLLAIALWGAGVSFMSFVSITYNNTNDPSFLTYFISMCVWVCAAYVSVSFMRLVHGYLSVKLVADYLIAVCVAQCLIAFAIGQSPFIANIVNSIFVTGSEGVIKGRLYGIGASFDPAGLRFMAVELIIAYIITILSEDDSKKYFRWYIFSFFIIGIIGNMISRTTTVGVVIGLVYLLWSVLSKKNHIRENLIRLGKYFAAIVSAIVISSVFLYRTNENIRHSLEYGFEGFFSLYESGEWNVSSNDGLIWMWKNIKPEKTRTWIIGDGYCDDPLHDPYYTGKQTNGGFYMRTDVGYMRFIFYFGTLGTLVFMGYFSKVAFVCSGHFPDYKNMFLLLLLSNFIGWMKVTSDIFAVFAIFLALILYGCSEKKALGYNRVKTVIRY